VTTSLAFLVLLAPLAYALVAGVARHEPGPRPRRVVRAGAAAGWFAVVVSVASVGVAVADGAVQSPTLGVAGLGLAVRLDPLSTVMFCMVALLAVVIVRFSGVYLDGDARQGDFLGRLALTIAAVQVLVLSGNLALLVAAWIATSLALHRLLVFYPTRRRAVVAARKKFIAARLGDAFLVVTALLLYRHAGSGDLGTVFASAQTPGPQTWGLGGLEVAALCLAAAAVLKSALFPTHGWLVEVMETPTPVSALLHAGILNAGPFLAIRMADVLEGAAAATLVLIGFGGVTALFASVVLLTQPSVKVALGYSSAAHMGFMLMVCGMGLYPAALLHLVAHSFYKAHAFLASGSAIDEARAAPVALPARLGRPARLLASLGVALALYLGFALVWGQQLADDPVLLAVGAILVLGTTQLVAPALDSAGPVSATAQVVGLAGAVTAAFFTLEAGAHALLSSTVPDHLDRGPAHLLAVGVFVVLFAGAVAVQMVEPTRPMGSRFRTLAIHLRNGFYANALFDRAVGALRVPTYADARR